MADTTITSTPAPVAAAPSKSVSPVIFWIVTAVLAIAIGVIYYLLNQAIITSVDNVKTALNALKDDQNEKRETALAEQKKLWSAEVAKLQEANKKLETDKAAVADLQKLDGEYKTFVTKEFPEVKKAHDAAIAATNQDLSKTNSNVNVVETKVKYLTENIDKINNKLLAIDKDILGLNTSNGELKASLKAEHDSLTKELMAVQVKGSATAEEMAKLELRTEQFENKVLIERAKAAVEYAKKRDLKGILDQLDFKN